MKTISGLYYYYRSTPQISISIRVYDPPRLPLLLARVASIVSRGLGVVGRVGRLDLELVTHRRNDLFFFPLALLYLRHSVMCQLSCVTNQ